MAIAKQKLKDFIKDYKPNIPNIEDLIIKTAGHKLIGSLAAVPGSNNAEYVLWCSKCGEELRGQLKLPSQRYRPEDIDITCPHCGTSGFVPKDYSRTLYRTFLYCEVLDAPYNLSTKPVDNEILAIYWLRYTVTYKDTISVHTPTVDCSYYILKGVGAYELDPYGKVLKKRTTTFSWGSMYGIAVVSPAARALLSDILSKNENGYDVLNFGKMDEFVHKYTFNSSAKKNIFSKTTDYDFPFPANFSDIEQQVLKTRTSVYTADADSYKQLILRKFGFAGYLDKRVIEQCRIVIGKDYEMRFHFNLEEDKWQTRPVYYHDDSFYMMGTKKQFAEVLNKTVFAGSKAEIYNYPRYYPLEEYLHAYVKSPCINVFMEKGLFVTLFKLLNEKQDPKLLFVNPGAPTIHEKLGLPLDMYDIVRIYAESIDLYGDYDLFYKVRKLCAADAGFDTETFERIFSLFETYDVTVGSARKDALVQLLSVVGERVTVSEALNYIARVVESQCIFFTDALSLWSEYYGLLMSGNSAPTNKQIFPSALKLRLDQARAVNGRMRKWNDGRNVENRLRLLGEQHIGDYYFEKAKNKADPRFEFMKEHYSYAFESADIKTLYFVYDDSENRTKPIAVAVLDDFCYRVVEQCFINPSVPVTSKHKLELEDTIKMYKKLTA